jgi:ATP-binding cassette subfamily B protein
MFDVIHARSIAVDLDYYENPRYQDTLHRAQQDAPYRPTRMVNGLMQLGQGAISLLGLAALLFSFHWVVGIILCAATVPSALVRSAFARRTYFWQRRRTPAERQAWYLNWLLTRDLPAKEIRLFGLGSLFMRRFQDLRRQLRLEKLQIDSRRSVGELVAAVVESGAAYGLYAYVGYRTLRGSLTVGDMVMFFQAMQRAQGFLAQILGSVSDLYESQLFLSSLFEFLELKPKVASPAQPVPIRRPARSSIAFDRVSFWYPGSARKALDDSSRPRRTSGWGTSRCRRTRSRS